MKSSTCSCAPKRRILTTTLLLAMLVLPACAMADNPPPVADARQAQRMTPAVRVFRQASPAVVNISTTTIVTVQNPTGFGRLFDDIFAMPHQSRTRQYQQHSVGSGFLIHGDGYLITNAHVVDRVSECRITFSDGTELQAEEVAIDRDNDLAVLKVDTDKPLPHITLGRSDDIMPGETVIAIGNPLGYAHTVTTGIVSAVNRDLSFNDKLAYKGLIQTDAPINPGNSGGPLFNVLGELIGINTAIRGDAQNIGFAIPVNKLHALLPEILDIERLRHVRFGLHFDGNIATNSSGGLRIRAVDAQSPAAEAGCQPGDLVTQINGQTTHTFMEAFTVLDKVAAGHTLAMQVQRDGKRSLLDLKMTLTDLPKTNPVELMWNLFGLRVRELKPSEVRSLGLRRPRGLLVTEVLRTAEANQGFVQPGDLIISFGGWPVSNTDTLGHLIKQVKSGDVIPFKILRILKHDWFRREFALKAM